MIRKIAIAMVVAFTLTACGGGSSGGSGGSGGNQSLQLSALIIASVLTAGTYPVTVNHTGDASNASQICLTYNGEGPFCEGEITVTETSISRQAVTNNPGTYDVVAYVVTSTGNTNSVSTRITVQ